MHRRNAHLDTGKDLDFLAELDDDFQRFKKKFPVWTSVETAFYQDDDSILLIVNTTASADGKIPRTHGSRTLKPEDSSYAEIFSRHKFNERRDLQHWIVMNELKMLGEGWGDVV